MGKRKAETVDEAPAKRAKDITRLMRPMTKKAYERRDKLDAKRAELAKMEAKLATMQPNPFGSNAREEDAHQQKLLAQLLELRKEEYAKAFSTERKNTLSQMEQDSDHEDPEYEDYTVPSNRETNIGLRHYLNWRAHNELREWDVYKRDTEIGNAWNAMQRNIRTCSTFIAATEDAMALRVEIIAGLGKCLIDVLPSLEKRSGVTFKCGDATVRIFPVDNKDPDGVWRIARGQDTFGHIDATTDEVLLEERAELLRPLLQELAEKGPATLLEWGKRFKVCAVCAIPLTEEGSLERGMGSACFKKWEKSLS